MTISNNLFLAILAMDAYNRNYGAGLNVDGNQIGNATLGANSSILRDATSGQRLDQPASFFAQAYEWNGQWVISYRGTDTQSLGLNVDIWNGYAVG